MVVMDDTTEELVRWAHGNYLLTHSRALYEAPAWVSHVEAWIHGTRSALSEADIVDVRSYVSARTGTM